MYRQDTVERVKLIHERGGAIPMIEKVLRPTGTGRTGLSVLAWCVAQDLLASSGRSLTNENIVKLLNEEITNTSKALLGLEQHSTGFIRVTRRQVERVGTQLAKRLSYGAESAPTLDDRQRGGRQNMLESILDAIIDGSKPTDLTPSGHYALDGSGIHAWSRRPGYVDRMRAKKPRDAAEEPGAHEDDMPGTTAAASEQAATAPAEVAQAAGEPRAEVTAVSEPGPELDTGGPRTSKDLDARHGYKTAKSGDSEIFFGYDLYPFIRVRSEGDKSDHPHLVERFRLYAASSNEPNSTLPLIEQMHVAPVDPDEPRPRDQRIGKGPYPIRQLLADRAWSYKLPKNWADPLRELGIEQVADLHKNDHGVRDHEGMRIVAGSAHCPAMPDDLIDIQRPARLALTPDTTVGELGEDMTPEQMSAAQRDTADFMARIEQRKSWAMIRMANGKTGERVKCPARECKVSCPLVALSDTEEVRNSGVPRVDTPPAADGRPQCCTQITVELPFTVTPKVRQTHYWGSLKWIKSFARRTHVEGVFGNVKNRNCENLARGWLQTPGLVRTSIGMAFVLAAYNRRTAQSWNDRTSASTDPAFRPIPPFLGYREITEDEDQQAA